MEDNRLTIIIIIIIIYYILLYEIILEQEIRWVLFYFNAVYSFLHYNYRRNNITEQAYNDL